MKHVLWFCVVTFFFVACQRNAITGRKQFTVLVPEAEAQSVALSQYKEFIKTNKVISTGNKDADMVKRVGNRIINAINTYYKSKGLTKELEGYSWEVNLVEDKQINAWCMPGGKIVVYTGILPVTQNEAALAVVMGHEIAHALAKHGSERMSQAMVQQGLGLGLALALSDKPAATQEIFNTAYGVTSNAVVMPAFSRSHELEADRFGLMFSALAGYNPKEAIPFWQRMSKIGGASTTPNFMRTHPTDEVRIAELEKIMDETINNYYKPATSN
ncbi:MAG: M48 family metallopeptidase [Sediminibacterium sp.]|nr:M48 family metallopeptidase [Sediminibacterium sp.]MBX9781164.1 M48 family metallopeptidase [Chitinophagaceae bacterium]